MARTIATSPKVSRGIVASADGRKAPGFARLTSFASRPMCGGSAWLLLPSRNCRLSWSIPMKNAIVWSCLAWLVALPARLPAQKGKEKPTPGDEMIYKYLCAEADKLSKKFLDGAKTLEEWQKKRRRRHQEYMEMLGVWPLPEKTPLKATITATLEHEGIIVDNLHFQSKPGLYVTANLYRPKENDKRARNGKQEKLPTILYVCGHSNRGRDGNKSAYQDHGMWFASNGYNCLVLDSLQLGEIPAVHHGTYGV